MKTTTLELIETLDENPDKVVVARMIDKEWEKELKDAYTKGQRHYAYEYSKMNMVLKTICVYLLILFCIGIFFYLHTINVNQDKLEASELESCIKGDYGECLKGFVRISESSNPNYRRAEIYQEVYYRNTGKYLVNVSQ